jgi:hypothetical protein
MKRRAIITVLIIAGVLGVVAAIWTGLRHGPEPIREGQEGGPFSIDVRYIFMVLALIGSVGALVIAGMTKSIGNKKLGIATLVAGALLIPTFIQANVLSMLAFVLLYVVGGTLLLTPRKIDPDLPED